MFRKLTRDRYLSDAELARFLAAVRTRRHVHQPRDHALFALLANTGIRPSEARALRRRDVFLSARWIQLARPKKPHGPDPINRLPISRAVAMVLRAYVTTLGRDQLLFPFCKRQTSRLFRYYAAKAGIPINYRIYSLRHSVGMRLWRHTGDIRAIQGIMGHVHLKATAGYVHASPERMRAAHLAMGTIV